MMLERIVEKKRHTLEGFKAAHDTEALIRLASDAGSRPGSIPSFKAAIRKPGLSLIGEIKKASPSKGIIKEDFDPLALAEEYEGAVEAISVLTEEHFFLGSPRYLQQVRQVSSLPLLRKDFIIDAVQIYESRLLGASCILLIAAILPKEALARFIDLSRFLGLDALVEVHNEAELELALDAGAEIIGINNRNLKDFSIDLNTTVRLRTRIPAHIPVVSESGIRHGADLKNLKKAGVDGILVGESFMKASNIKDLAKEYKAAYENDD